MIGVPKFKIGHVTVTTPFSGWFLIHWLVLAVFNLSTKFEVFIFTDNKNMKGDANYRIWGALW